MSVESSTTGFIDLEFLSVYVFGTPQRKLNHAGGHRVVAHPVDQDKGPHGRAVLVALKGNGTVGFDGDHGEVIELKLCRCHVLKGVDVDFVFDRRDVCVDLGGAELQPNAAT